MSGKSEELERLAIGMYVRELSLRDIEAAFTDARGRCVLSRMAASTVAERLWTDYQEFATRSLAQIRIVYLFVDGVAERLHLGQPREAVLAAWGSMKTPASPALMNCHTRAIFTKLKLRG